MKVRLPEMPIEQVQGAIEEWLDEHYGWHTVAGIAVGIAEATGMWVSARAVRDALVDLGFDRIAACATLRHRGRERPVWTRARWLEEE